MIVELDRRKDLDSDRFLDNVGKLDEGGIDGVRLGDN